MRPSLGLAASAALFIAAPTLAANVEDAALNAVYAGLARARAAHDVGGMAGAFSPDALLIDQRPGPPIGGRELAGVLQPFRDRLVADGVRIETAYRVERRSVSGDVALDAGFMRQSLARPDGQSSVRYARFLVTMRREADGVWRIIGDAAMPATEAVWNGLARTEGLHFDG
jgi:uncharacterized protein (TIGR02246 family)